MERRTKYGRDLAPQGVNFPRRNTTKRGLAIRVPLQMKHHERDLTMFNLAIDSKLRGCDLVSLRVDDIASGGHVRDRATTVQHKTGRPVQFEITEQTRVSLQEWLKVRPVDRGPRVFPSRVHYQPHVTARQYARIVHGCVEAAAMDSYAYGTHSLRRIKAAQIYGKTGNLRAVRCFSVFRHGKFSPPIDSFSAIRKSRARFATSEPRSMTL